MLFSTAIVTHALIFIGRVLGRAIGRAVRGRRVAALVAALVAAPLAVAQSGAARSAAAQNPDDTFLAAREAFRVGNRERLAQLAERLRGHPLEMYADYWQLMLRRADAADADYEAFLARHDNSVLAERTRVEWLRALGKRRAWEQFDAVRPRVAYTEDLEVLCYSALARVMRKDEDGVREAMALWLTPRELPEGCAAMAEQLIAQSRLLDRHVWDRIRALADANQPAALKRTADYLPDSQALDLRQTDAAFNQPEAWLRRGVDLRTRAQRELALIAVGRLARSEPRDAAGWWTRLGKKPFTETEIQWGWAQIGYQAARRLLPEADDWFSHASEIQLSDEYLQWMARAGLRAGDWKLVARAIRDMTPELQRDPAWVYWLARSHKEAGRAEEARALFESIAPDFSFYGQLAAAEFGRPTVIPPVGHVPGKDEVAAIAQLPGFQRALILYRLGLRVDANREWVFSIRGLDDRALLAAAHFARERDLPDRAINTADKTRSVHDFTLRFLSPHADQVRPQAKSLALDDAWVYGLMRQESRFIMNAKSVAGASGLMQLMPATARWVAKKIGLADYHHGRVNDLDTNIALGTNYLKIVLDELHSHQALASAAYNAGPGRPRRWRDVKPMEAAIFAESIPFNETRDYVKKVISNAVFYQALFTGKPASIKDRLPPIPPRRADERGSDTP
ncbi:MAG: lytic transglycosylase domain-containing protein [Burkholderiales bacterium]|nr:lytic transglycosylase domain-containing protein [Burkholderiales bacterium]